MDLSMEVTPDNDSNTKKKVASAPAHLSKFEATFQTASSRPFPAQIPSSYCTTLWDLALLALTCTAPGNHLRIHELCHDVLLLVCFVDNRLHWLLVHRGSHDQGGTCNTIDGLRLSWITVSITVLSKQCVDAITMWSEAWVNGRAPDLVMASNKSNAASLCCFCCSGHSTVEVSAAKSPCFDRFCQQPLTLMIVGRSALSEANFSKRASISLGTLV